MCMKAKLLAFMFTLLIVSASFVVSAVSLVDSDDFCGVLSEPVSDDDVVILSKGIVSGEGLVDEVDALVGDLVRFRVVIVYKDSDGEGVGKAYKIKDIVVTDVLPVGLVYVGNATRGESSVSDGVVVWDLGGVELWHNESFSLEFDVRVVRADRWVNVVYVDALEKCISVPRSVNDSAIVLAEGSGVLDVEIVKPKVGYLYFFNMELGETGSDRTSVWGPVTIVADVVGEGEVVKVEYYINDFMRHVDYPGRGVSAGSFSWTWFWKPVVGKLYNVEVRVYDDEGNVYSDEIEVERVRLKAILVALFGGSLLGLKVLNNLLEGDSEEEGDGDSDDGDVVSVPVARIVGGPFEGFVNESILFDASGSEGVGLVFEWDFDDGSSGSGEEVSHSYAKEGTYDVVLVVKDGDGEEDTESVTVIIKQAESEKDGDDDSDKAVDVDLFWYIVLALALLLFAIIALLFVGGKFYE